MELHAPELERYLDGLAAPDDALHDEMAALAAELDFPHVGPQGGALLRWLAAGIDARKVLELGSGFGYSAWWLTQAVGRRGYVILTERSKEHARRAKDFLDRAGRGERARIEVGDALETLERLDGPFDLIFNDIDKQSYPRTIELVAERLRPGGLFVTDNTLWQGKVASAETPDEMTAAVQSFNRQLGDDARFDTLWLPVRDGLAVARLRA